MKRPQFKGYIGIGSLCAKRIMSKEEKALNRRIDTMNGIRHYRTEYTDKQKMYIAGTVPKEEIRKTEITQLLNKALGINDQKTFDIVSDRYDEEFFRDYKPKYTKEEAIKILEEIDKS